VIRANCGLSAEARANPKARFECHERDADVLANVPLLPEARPGSIKGISAFSFPAAEGCYPR